MSLDEDPATWRLFPNVGPAPRMIRQRDRETGDSILVRLAIANGMRNVGHLLRSTPHLRAKGVLNREHRIEIAARLSGFDVSQIAKSTPKRTTYRTTHVTGETFNMAKSPAGRLCPTCIEQDLAANEEARLELRPYRRDWWQVPAISTCPFHGTLLVSACTHCGGVYDERLPAGSCKCGYAVGPGNPAEDCAHDAWLLGRLGIGPVSTSPLLDTMPPHTAAELSRIVGKAVTQEPFRGASREHPAYLAEMRSRGWHLLGGGLPAFERLLDDIVARERGRARYCNTSYAGIHPFLTRNHCASLDGIRNLLAGHAERNLGLGGSRARLFNRLTFEGDKVSVTRAADAIDTSEPRLLAILAAIEPDCVDTVASTRLMSRSQFVSVRDALANSIRSSDARALLGFTPRMFGAASEAGLFDYLIPASRTYSLVRRGSVDAMLRKLARPPVVAPEGLLDAKLFARAAGISTADVLLAVASNLVRPAGRRSDRKGFPGLLFRADDASVLRPLLRGQVSKKRAAAELGWLKGTMSALREAKLLDVGPGQTVAISSLESFRRRFANPAEAHGWMAEPMPYLAFCHMLRRRCGQPVVSGHLVTPFWDRRLLADRLGSMIGADAVIHAIGFASGV